MVCLAALSQHLNEGLYVKALYFFLYFLTLVIKKTLGCCLIVRFQSRKIPQIFGEKKGNRTLICSDEGATILHYRYFMTDGSQTPIFSSNHVIPKRPEQKAPSVTLSSESRLNVQ